jgi:hypothetical protein
MIGEIEALGYETRVIALNFMHAMPRRCLPAPQLRDRLYVAYLTEIAWPPTRLEQVVASEGVVPELRAHRRRGAVMEEKPPGHGPLRHPLGPVRLSLPVDDVPVRGGRADRHPWRRRDRLGSASRREGR